MDVMKNLIGLDCGSVAVSAVKTDSNGGIIDSEYRIHYGDVRKTLDEVIGKLRDAETVSIAVTDSAASFFNGMRHYDDRVSLIRGVKERRPDIRTILYVGGEKFGLIEFDETGAYRKFKANSSCAAGTGSFLDQQAKRLSLSGIAEFCDVSFSNTGSIPKIASRCAVFAKTDLIHAQQEGYSLAEICDGLCMGLAKNIADTIATGEKINMPAVFAGGVSKNKSVVKHLSSLLDAEFVIDGMSVLYGALGAVLSRIDEGNFENDLDGKTSLLREFNGISEDMMYAPLELALSDYPDFSSVEKYLFSPAHVSTGIPVEVDIYRTFTSSMFEGYIGIDIGSTSTKAALVSADGEMTAGLYTRTSGRPLDAVKAIFEAIDDISKKKNLTIRIIGSGTTGSGRKFIGKIIGADCVIDEITAHARAAFELNPSIDTIIEIGGQDAKFTTMRNGMVNFSVMNSVCAAGTGSFIEEQAARLGCPLAEISPRAEKMRAPMVSDRCTVFMERDINHILSNGHSVDEALASVLHSVRDNYLTKVAVEGAIGTNVCFQGATAKNRMLVAAFEQKLKKPIYVSEFCHLTGAFGVALVMKDESRRSSAFRGIGIYTKDIPLEGEICGLCNNSCKITVARIDDESVAYGFLCGRDYDTKKFVDKNISGFDLLKERAKTEAFAPVKDSKVTVGLPSALHMTEEMPLWKYFFSKIGIRTVSSENFRDAVKTGKNHSGAEFCAPMSAMHGHVIHLSEKSDFVFFPVYIEGRDVPKGARRQYCYYTQFAPSLAANMEKGSGKVVNPVLNHTMNVFSFTVQLYKAVKRIKPDVSYFEIYSAYESAKEYMSGVRKKTAEIFNSKYSPDELSVVFLGRPYTVLSPSMNKGIPGIFANLNVKTFYQDMISLSKEQNEEMKNLLSSMHWHYASKILEAAYAVSKTPGLYPVFVTSFKCSPDSIAIEYFRRIMDAQDKPYLILQLDEHDSNVGYETRIEAALRSFRNHFSGSAFTPLKRKKKIVHTVSRKIKGKTLLIPAWDSISCKFLAATLVKEGIDARLLEEDRSVIQRSMRHNTGQCIPMNVIAQEVVEYMEKYHLHPEHTAVWMLDSGIACNIRMYPYFIKNILEAHGRGFDKTEVYVGEVTFTDLGPTVSLSMYFAYMFGGMIRKLACRIRPYEINKGETDRVSGECTEMVYSSIIAGTDRETVAKRIVELFSAIRRHEGVRPLVAIFGDIYSRDNDVMNQDLIRTIESAGGEVITTSYIEYARMIASPYMRKWLSEGHYSNVITCEAILAVINRLDRKYYRIFEPLLGRPYPEYDFSAEEVLKPFNVTMQHTGESLDNLIKVTSIVDHYPEISLFVQASPAFCCPSLVTEAMSKDIERVTGVPVVSVTYDGTGSNVNSVVVPYIRFPRTAGADDESEEKASI
jgi:predicted CoA-substrate-specific enzyme activase